MFNFNTNRIPNPEEFFSDSKKNIQYSKCEKFIHICMENKIKNIKKFIINNELIINDKTEKLTKDEKKHIIETLTRRGYICFDDGDEGITVRPVPENFKLKELLSTNIPHNPFGWTPGSGSGWAFGERPNGRGWWNM